MDELYRSETVVVRRVPMVDQSRWVVTFDNYGIGAGFDRKGFGEDFFRSRGISAIHVLGRSDDWYQYDDIFAALKTVRDAVSGSGRVMTYGSSMGGYAAIRFAQALDADAVLALSPQYSIDPAKVPYDNRWNQDSHRIRWLPAIDGPVRCRCSPVIVFDPKSVDGTHVLRLSNDIGVTTIPLAHTGHPVTTYLFEAGLLEPLVLAVLEDTLDAEAFRIRAWAVRKTSTAYLNEMARVQPSYRTRTSVQLARYASAIAPNDPNALSGLANQLSATGQHAEALALFEQAIALTGRLPTLLIAYANGLNAAGRIGDARRIAREVVAATPRHAHVWAWLAHLSWQAADTDDAWLAVNRAIALDPANPIFAEQRRVYETILGEGSKTSPVHRRKWLGRGRVWARRRFSLRKSRRRGETST